MAIRKGDKFRSFEDLENALEKFKHENFVDFFRRDSRKIESARKRGVLRPIKKELQYYEVKYCCIHGGQTYKSRGKGSRSTS